MSFLSRGRKPDLLILAEELGETVTPDLKVFELKTIITGSSSYEEEFVRGLLDNIIASRLEAEEEAKIVKEREFLLEKIRLENQSRDDSLASGSSQNGYVRSQPDISKLLPKFDPEISDINLYLVIFERQVRRANIEKSDWVSNLMRLLPIDIVQLIARENDSDAENYDYVKTILLKKFKLSPETFRQKFSQHQRKPESTFKEFLFEITNYFQGWLLGMEVADFESLKDLIITDQLKKRVDFEVRDHFIDQWANIKSPSKLADLLDNYEDVRKNKGKPFDKREMGERYNSSVMKENRFVAPKVPFKDELKTKSNGEGFDKRKVARCYECNSTQHLRYNCPIILGRNEEFERVNFLKVNVENTYLAPYLMPGFVNEHEITFLWDSGSTLDIVCRKYISPDSYTGETVWVKQPLDINKISLPLAFVEISGDFGKVKTKAAVCANELDEGRYILGNRTASLIKEKIGYEFSPTGFLNAIQIRSHSKKSDLEQKFKNEEILADPNTLSPDGESILSDLNYGEPLEIPEVVVNTLEMSLSKINCTDFKTAQQKSPDLKELFKIAPGEVRSTARNTSALENEILVKIKEEHCPVTENDFVLINGFRRYQELAMKTITKVQVEGNVWATSNPNGMAVQLVGPGPVGKKISETSYVVEVSGGKERSEVYGIDMLEPSYKGPEFVNLLIVIAKDPVITTSLTDALKGKVKKKNIFQV